MKALDILIYILECGGMIHVDREFMSNVSKAVEELKEHLSDKDDQIKWLREELKYHEAELEALQQPKSCEGCIFHDDVGWDDWCCDCIRKLTIDRYEAKEQ